MAFHFQSLASSDTELVQVLRRDVDDARSLAGAPMGALALHLAHQPVLVPSCLDAAVVEVIGDAAFGSEVTVMPDVQKDPRAPLSWLSHNIAASVSVPVWDKDRQVGSLHIMDTRVRSFSEVQVEGITQIAQSIGRRLGSLDGPTPGQRREALMRQAVAPVLAELRNALVPLHLGTGDLSEVISDLTPMVTSIRLSPKECDQVAVRGYDDLVELQGEIGRAAERVRQMAAALAGLWGDGRFTVEFLDIWKSALALASPCQGFLEYPETSASSFATVCVPRTTAVAIVATVLSLAMEECALGQDAQPLQVQFCLLDGWCCVHVTGTTLAKECCERIAKQVHAFVGGEPSVRVAAEDKELIVYLARL